MSGILFWLCVLIIIYVYAGYPLLVTVLARLRPAQTKRSGHTPSVTLLIAAYNEESVIAGKLENSLALDYPREQLQILVAADGSDDQTAEIVRSFADRGIELSYDPARRGKLAAINRAMQQVRNEIVVFSDANNIYDAQTLSILVQPFADPTVGATTGSKNIIKAGSQLAQADGLYWRYESFIKEQETRLGCCVGVAGEIFAIRQALYTRPPDKIINDDFFIALNIIKQGFRIAYVPEARSSEAASLNEDDELVRRTRIVAGRYQAMSYSLSHLPFHQPLVVWQILSHKFLRPLIPFAMIGALVANLAALVFSSSQTPGWLFLSPPIGAILFVLQLGFYLLAWFGMKIKPGGLIGKVIYLPTFLVNSNYAALLGLIRYMTGKQTVLWKKVSR
jgi:cellulose synthase/poly-beta-1,6-N-acetylglucosamine synthase-like glycosyltransferase